MLACCLAKSHCAWHAPLVALARDGDAGGKKEAAAALRNLTDNPTSRAAVAEGLGLPASSSEKDADAAIGKL